MTAQIHVVRKNNQPFKSYVECPGCHMMIPMHEGSAAAANHILIIRVHRVSIVCPKRLGWI